MTAPTDAEPDMLKVLIIEDDAAVAAAFEAFLARSGMQVAVAGDAAAGLRAIDTFRPHVSLVDLGLPDADGLSLVRHMVERESCGVIVVTGAGSEVERSEGMELGADDYVIKPPSMRELAARIRAVHRRIAGRGARAADGVVAHAFGGVRMVAGDNVVHARGAAIRLTSAEARAFELIIAAQGAPVSRDQVCEAALRRPYRAEDRSVDQLILGIRRKFAAAGLDPTMIGSVRGAGYALVPHEEALLPQ